MIYFLWKVIGNSNIRVTLLVSFNSSFPFAPFPRLKRRDMHYARDEEAHGDKYDIYDTFLSFDDTTTWNSVNVVSYRALAGENDL